MTYLGTLKNRIKIIIFKGHDAELINRHYGKEITIVPTFYRLRKNGEIFFCKEYGHTSITRRNSYTVMYRRIVDTCVSYGQILYFIFIDQPSAVIRKFNTLPAPFYQVPSIISVQQTNIIEVISISNILEKCVFIEIDDVCYVVKLLCTLNVD